MQPALIPAQKENPQGKTCPVCGNTLAETAKFRPNCGTKQAAETALGERACPFLHGIWDCLLRLFGNYDTQIILTVVAWIITLTPISAGLKQITRLSKKRSEDPAVSEEV